MLVILASDGEGGFEDGRHGNGSEDVSGGAGRRPGAEGKAAAGGRGRATTGGRPYWIGLTGPPAVKGSAGAAPVVSCQIVPLWLVANPRRPAASDSGIAEA